jgi:hypothetical protein
MDLRHAIPELRKVIQFLKPLMQADELLKSILDFEKQEVEKKELVGNLDKEIEKKESVLKGVNDRIKIAEADRSKVVDKAAEDAKIKGDAIFCEFATKIDTAEQTLLSLVDKIKNDQTVVNSLRTQKVELENKVAALNKVLESTGQLTSKV